MKIFAKGHRLEASGYLFMMVFYIAAAVAFHIEIIRELKIALILTSAAVFIASYLFTLKQGRRMYYANLAILPLLPFFIMFARTDSPHLLENFATFVICGNLGIATCDCYRRLRGRH